RTAGTTGSCACFRAVGAGARIARPDADAALPLYPRAVSKCPVRLAAANAAGGTQYSDSRDAPQLLRRETDGRGLPTCSTLRGRARVRTGRGVLSTRSGECHPRLRQSGGDSARAPGIGVVAVAAG